MALAILCSGKLKHRILCHPKTFYFKGCENLVWLSVLESKPLPKTQNTIWV